MPRGAMGPALRTVLTALLVCLLPPAAGTDHDPLSPEERAWVEANGPIVYASEATYPPFEFTTANGTLDGINMDLLNRMSRNLGIEFEVVRYDDWSRVLEAMEAREAQVVGAVAPTAQREAYMDFVGPYMSLGQVFYVNTDRTDLRSAEDMDGRRVAVVHDYAARQWLAENRPGVVQVPVENVLGGLEAVSSGSVDGFFDSVPVAGYHIRQHSLSNVRMLGEPLHYSPANWAVGEGETVLAGILRKGLDSIAPGDQTAVFEYWTGYDLGVPPAAAGASTFSPVALAVVGVLAAGVVAVAAWTWTLQRVVEARTQDLSDSRDEVRRINRELESRVQERSQEVRMLMERKDRLYEELDSGARRMTHDLDRAASELRERYQGVLRPNTLLLLDAARSSAWTLAGMVAATVETARTEADAPNGEVSLATLLKREVDAAAQRGPQPPVLACAGDLPVRCHPGALERLAAHLVASSVALGASAVHASGSPDGVQVILTGCGGRVGDPKALLEPLREPGLAGLSLPAVARIVQRNGGDVDVRRAGADLVLTLRFPAEPALRVAATD